MFTLIFLSMRHCCKSEVFVMYLKLARSALLFARKVELQRAFPLHLWLCPHGLWFSSVPLLQCLPSSSYLSSLPVSLCFSPAYFTNLDGGTNLANLTSKFTSSLTGVFTLKIHSIFRWLDRCVCCLRRVALNQSTNPLLPGHIITEYDLHPQSR